MLVTQGTGEILVGEARGVSYDSLARNLTHFDASVDPRAIAWEGYSVRGKTYMYFGAFPAFLRILPVHFFPSTYGRWSRVSVLLGIFLSVLGLARTARRALAANTGLSTATRSLVLLAAVAGWGLGTPATFVASTAIIYHEAMTWGLCGGIWGVSFALDLARNTDRSLRALAGLSTAFGVALLSRVTFALPLGLAGVIFGGALLLQALHRPRPVRARAAAAVLAASLPALAALAFQLWYNVNRFGSIWSAIDTAATFYHPERFGGFVNLRRAPTALRAYLGDSGIVSMSPPVFEPETVRYPDPKLFYGWRDQTFSLLLGSTWLVAAAGAGAILLARGKGRTEGVLVGAFAVQALVITSFGFVTQRYSSELLPLLAVLLAAFLSRVRWPGGSGGRALAAAGTLLLAFSTAATLGSTLSWNLLYNGDAPSEYRERLARLLSAPPYLPRVAGREVALADVRGAPLQPSFGPPRPDRTWRGAPISLRGWPFARGITFHANSAAAFEVPAGATEFRAVAGLPDDVNRYWTTAVVLEVRDGENHLLWRSPLLRNAARPLPVRVPLSGERFLVLAVSNERGGIQRDDVATWAGAAFVVPPG
jgi:NPCBM/NEW2 domain-containing protein